MMDYTDQFKLALFEEMREALTVIAERADIQDGDSPLRECQHILARACAMLARLPKE